MTTQIKINPHGENLYDVLSISKAELFEIILDNSHELNEKVLLSNYLAMSEVTSMVLVGVTLQRGSIPENTSPIYLIDLIFNLDLDFCKSLVTLLGIEDFYTSEQAVQELKTAILGDESLSHLLPKLEGADSPLVAEEIEIVQK